MRRTCSIPSHDRGRLFQQSVIGFLIRRKAIYFEKYARTRVIMQVWIKRQMWGVFFQLTRAPIDRLFCLGGLITAIIIVARQCHHHYYNIIIAMNNLLYFWVHVCSIVFVFLRLAFFLFCVNHEIVEWHVKKLLFAIKSVDFIQIGQRIHQRETLTYTIISPFRLFSIPRRITRNARLNGKKTNTF